MSEAKTIQRAADDFMGAVMSSLSSWERNGQTAAERGRREAAKASAEDAAGSLSPEERGRAACIPDRELGIALGRGVELQELSGIVGVRALRLASLVALWGSTGAGKSVAAAYWLCRLQPHRRARWVSSSRVARMPLDTVSGRDEFDRLVEASALVLDDVGRRDADRESRRLAGPVQELLAERHARFRATFCTTNLSPQYALDAAISHARAKGDQAMLAQLSRMTSWERYLDDEPLVDRWRKTGHDIHCPEKNLRVRLPGDAGDTNR